MKTKLKAQPPPPERPRFERVVDFGVLFDNAVRVLGKKRAEALCFALSELDEACETLRMRVRQLSIALWKAGGDATDLYDNSSSLLGELLHLRSFTQRALTAVRNLADKARQMAPLDDVTDDELSDRAIKASEAFIRSRDRGRNASQRKHRPKPTGPSNRRSSRANEKNKRPAKEHAQTSKQEADALREVIALSGVVSRYADRIVAETRAKARKHPRTNP